MDRVRVDSRWIRTTLRFWVWGVSTKLAPALGCSTAGPAVGSISGASSSAVASSNPVSTTLTNGFLANDLLASAGLLPISGDSEAKPSARSHSPTEPKKQTLASPAGEDFPGRPRH